MNEPRPDPRKKRKVDVAALQSEFKRRIPSLDLLAARDLMDCGFCHMDDLRGRSPSAIMESVRKLRPETPADRLWVFRMMVYLAENEDPDPRLLNPHAWSNRDY